MQRHERRWPIAAADLLTIAGMSHRTETTAATIWAVIPAAGIGQRALPTGSQHATPPVPKQYQRILGVSILAHTLQAFAQVEAIAQTVVVIAPGDSFFATQAENHVTKTQAFAAGGASRAASVCNGLQLLRQQLGAQDHDWVLVHDAARCLITPQWIERLIAACQDDAVGGLLAMPLPDTLKEQRDDAAANRPNEPTGPRVLHTVPRSGKWLAQTPQMFRLGPLHNALEHSTLAHITDEASAMELQGHAPKLVASSAQNFKVTYPEDFALAEAVLRARSASVNGTTATESILL